jgi:neutral ceramidase
MKLGRRIPEVCFFLLVATVANREAWSAEAGALRAGAAKVDITPADPTGLANLWGHRFTGVRDKIYARAIVLDNGETSAAIVTVETVEITDGAPIVAHISQETGIPAANIIVAATHDHNAPIVALQNADGTQKSGPDGVAFVAKVDSDVVTAVKQAKANMQAARMGVARGFADINVNRDESTPNGYIMGWNPKGLSDKTVWVLKIETTTGKPIAFLINYAVHAAIIGVENTLLTGELPGATSRYVEQHYDDKIVALWTSSAAGDQNPIVMSAAVIKSSQKQAGDSQTNLDNFEAVDVLGRILGEEVVRVADSMKADSSQPRIWGAEKVVTCPGQKILDRRLGEPMREVKSVDAGPVNFRLGVLMIDKVAITWVSAEVVTKTYQEVRKQSPFADTLMITLANGRIGYLPDDASYDVWTREAIASPLKKGCGESTIVNGLVGLMRQY